MKHLSFSPLAIAASAFALCLSGCGGGSSQPPADDGATFVLTGNGPQSVTIDFVLTVGATPVDCNSTLAGLGLEGANAKLRGARFYASNIAFETTEGALVPLTLTTNSFQTTQGADSVGLINFGQAAGLCEEGGPRHVQLTGTLPPGRYDAMKFMVGVPESLNHSDTATAPAPLNNPDLAWNWMFGRRHMVFEIDPEKAGAPGTFTGAIAIYDGTTGEPTGDLNDTFYMHMGNTGCSSPAAGQYSCTSSNQRTLHLHDFNPTTQRVAVDLKELFKASKLREERGAAPGCMSSSEDPECKAMWSVLGATFDANGNSQLITDSPYLHGQTVMRAIAK